MKRMMLVLMTLALLCGVAFAQEEDPAGQAIACELSNDDTTLTVTLPANATTGFEWTCTMSEEGMLAEVSHEYIADEAEDAAAGAGGVSVFVFDSAMDQSGLVTLTFQYARSWEDAAEEVHEVDVWVDEANLLSVEAVRQTWPVAWAVGAKMACPDCGNPDAEVVEAIDGGDEEGGVFWMVTLDCPDCGPVEWTPDT